MNDATSPNPENLIQFVRSHQTDLYTPPEGKHAVWPENGCIVLVHVPQAVEVLKRRVNS
jgi:hypothetical protein